ncbi:hypothetical protein HBB16_03785 [Pseudonocardia sp. MCCB 268]|nr:hypothetical protein [Pseudonocardia cytotoxica]
MTFDGWRCRLAHQPVGGPAAVDRAGARRPGRRRTRSRPAAQTLQLFLECGRPHARGSGCTCTGERGQYRVRKAEGCAQARYAEDGWTWNRAARAGALHKRLRPRDATGSCPGHR